MTIEQFQNGIIAFDDGLVPFNRGMTITSFLHANKWYPVRAFFCYSTENQTITTQDAIKIITCLIPYTRISDSIDYSNCDGFSIRLSEHERMVELRHLKLHLNQLIGE